MKGVLSSLFDCNCKVQSQPPLFKQVRLSDKTNSFYILVCIEYDSNNWDLQNFDTKTIFIKPLAFYILSSCLFNHVS